MTTLITGVSKGIGNSLCKYYLSKQMPIIGISRSLPNIDDSNLTYIQQDIVKRDTYDIINKAIETKHINVCIINAGIYSNNMFHKMTYDQWFNVLNTNIISSFNVLNPVINNMRNNNGGKIVIISSVVADIGSMGASNYACSKSAIHGLVKSLALENANKNIQINSLSPGYINTGMGNDISDAIKFKVEEKIPMKKFGDIDDIIKGVDFLLDNNYITGSNININGGLA